VAPDDLPIEDDLVIPGGELTVSVSRSSGPGGQHVNTSDTRVQLRWNVLESTALDEVRRGRLLQKLAPRLTVDGDLLVTSDTHRSQHRNREEARARLADIVRQALQRPRPRRRTQAPRAARQKRLEQKKRRADVKRQRRDPTRNRGDD
jgi:ribosome-associated protein